MAEEVSRNVLGIFDFASESLGISRSELFSGLDVDPDNLPERISWDDFVTIVARVQEKCTRMEQLAEIGETVFDLRAMSRSWAIVGWIASLRALFVASHRWGGPSMFRHLDELTVEDVAEKTLRLGMRVPEPYQVCEGFFWINLGVMRSMPKLLGLAKSRVDIQVNDRYCYYTVHLPQSMTLWSRLTRWMRLFSSPSAALNELSEQHRELSERYEELEHTRDALAEANAHLEEQRAIALMEKDKAEEALLVKTEFLSTMSHELRTPLNGVYGAAVALRDNEDDPQERQEMLEILLSSSEQLLGFIENILQFAEMSRGELQKNDLQFCLAEVVEDTAREYLGAARHKLLEFSWKVAPDLPDKLTSDPFRIAQVMRILIDNAIKFTERGTVDLEVELSEDAESEGKNIEIVVRDTGVGIEQAKQSKVFELFTQGNASASRSFGGVGLGLASARHIAHSLGGEITFSSTVGEGATFRFVVPIRLELQGSPQVVGESEISVAKNLPSSAKHEYEDKKIDTKKGSRTAEVLGRRSEQDRESNNRCVQYPVSTKTVLVVDDDATNRRILGLQLKKMGFLCDFAENGQVAVDLAKACKYDAIFMDCEMPEMNGYDATSAIRAAEESDCHTLILAATAYTSANDRKRCQDAGMDGFLAKPIKRDVLFKTVEQWGLLGEDSSTSTTEKKRLELVPEMPVGVLVADDNPLNRRLLARLLKRMGCQVDEVDDGIQALKAAGEKDFDAIFLDVMMPGLDGPEVAEAVRKLEEPRSRVPIIAVTAFSAQANRERCIASGMDAFLSKPLSPRTLYSVLRQWLGDRGQQLRKTG